MMDVISVVAEEEETAVDIGIMEDIVIATGGMADAVEDMDTDTVTAVAR